MKNDGSSIWQVLNKKLEGKTYVKSASLNDDDILLESVALTK